MSTKSHRALIALCGALLLPLLVGCSNQAAPLTKQEQSDFKGGPMPESARQIIQQRVQSAGQSTPQSIPPSSGNGAGG